MRKKAVALYPQLTLGAYNPFDAVFGQIKDSSSWWGIEGEYYHDIGPRSIDGKSEESRFVLNPFLLVAADFLGLSIWYQGYLEWDKKKNRRERFDEIGFSILSQTGIFDLASVREVCRNTI